MSTRKRPEINGLALLPLMLFGWPALAIAQVPVDDNGDPVGDYAAVDDGALTGNEDIPLLTATELEELVGPIALYPDDLLAIVLPAAAYPLQIVQAGRFLEALEDDPTLTPDEDWDDSVVALVNYPEVVRLLNDDIDWTWRLGEAVVAQQADVIAAVETFRDRAYAAGNLRSDDHQTVSRDEGIIEITPVDDDVIYVPYYEPERVVIYQPRPVYYYYPDPCPVYYYPYPSSYAFHRGFFWGVTTAFTVGWHTDRLRVFHHSYRGHPYYGRYYWPRWRYRQPTINVYNNIYVNRYANRSRDYYRSGDDWRPRNRRTIRIDNNRVTRSRQYANDANRNSSRPDNARRVDNRHRDRRAETLQRLGGSDDIRFRERPARSATSGERDRQADRRRAERQQSSDRVRRDTRRGAPREAIQFRERPERSAGRSEQRRVTQRRATERPVAEQRSAERRTAERRATERRTTAPRVTRSTERRSTERRSTERRSAERRATPPNRRNAERAQRETRRAETRDVRRHETRRSEAGGNQRRQSVSKSRKSGSVRVAESSRKERPRSRERRH